MERALTVATLLAIAAPLPRVEARALQEAPPEPEPAPPSAAVAPPVASFQAVRGGYLGVRIEDVDAADSERLGLPAVRGALVAEVVDDSPADEAGIREDDVILGWDGEEVRSAAQLTRLVRETPPGRDVPVSVFRDGARRELAVTAGEREPLGALVDPEEWAGPTARMHERLARVRACLEEGSEEREERLEEMGRRLEERLGEVEVRPRLEGLPPEAVVVGARTAGGAGRLGVRIQRLTDQLARYFGVREDVGVLVASVEDDSPAGRAGIRAGDVIVEVGDEEIDSSAALRRALREAEAGPVDVTLVRDGKERGVTVELPERS